MNKKTYITTRKANGDTRTVALIGAEYDQIQVDLAPKQDPMAVVSEHIAPSLGIAQRERADGKKQTGTFDKAGLITWGAWS